MKQSEEKERAWFYLGVAQTENENDEAAIRALNETLQLNENNLEALMALSASYTNEGNIGLGLFSKSENLLSTKKNYKKGQPVAVKIAQNVPIKLL